MEERLLTRTGRKVSAVGLGTWQFGDGWNQVEERDVRAILDTAVASGVDFIDTADVYGDGRSERLIGRFLREFRTTPGERPTVATKIGRRGPQELGGFTLDTFRAWTDRSRANLGVDTLDLVQLHTPPDAVFASDAVFDALDVLVEEGRIAAYGVSVETCAQAMTALARPNVASVQIILNVFRRKPLERVLPAARPRAWASSPGSRWRPACCPRSSGGTPSSPRPTTAPTTGTARCSTSARPSPASTTRPVSRPRPSSPPGARGRHARTARPALGHPAGRRHHGHPGRHLGRPGAGERGGRVHGATARALLDRLRELYDRRIRAQVHHLW